MERDVPELKINNEFKAWRHCVNCGLDINLGDWQEHARAEALEAARNYPELFCEVGHE